MISDPENIGTLDNSKNIKQKNTILFIGKKLELDSKKLNYLGLLTGIIFIASLNLGHRTVIEHICIFLYGDYSPPDSDIILVNIIFLSLIWFFRGRIGLCFAFILNILSKVLSFIHRKI